SHVTGGGLAANLARVLPQGLVATVDRATWELPAIFKLVSEQGNVPLADLERTLNLGVGMVAIVSADAADAAVARLNDRGLPSCGSRRVAVAPGVSSSSVSGAISTSASAATALRTESATSATPK